jgi:ribosomal RNA-processing protein 12
LAVDAAADGPTPLPNLPTILTSLLASPPHPSQSADAVEYTSAVAAALIKLARQDPLSVEREYFIRAWTVVWNNVLVAPASSGSARQKAAEGLGGQGLTRYCITDRMVELALEYKTAGGHLEAKRQKMKPPLLIKIINQLEGAINTLPLMMPYLLPILTALISRLRRAPASLNPGQHGRSKADSPATSLLLPLVTAVADLRVQPGFEHKDKVDDVVGMAIEVMGVKTVLDALPLNVEPDE